MTIFGDLTDEDHVQQTGLLPNSLSFKSWMRPRTIGVQLDVRFDMFRVCDIPSIVIEVRVLWLPQSSHAREYYVEIYDGLARLKRDLIRAALTAALTLVASSGVADSDLDVELWRLDCGEFAAFPLDVASDVFAYPDRKKTLTNSCYLVRHNDDYMLWDTGFRPSGSKAGADGGQGKTLVEQLARIGVAPERVAYVGISHFHGDHTGQASFFPGARLLIGEPDFELLARGAQYGQRDDIGPWLTNTANVDRIVGDKDVFGDGTVVMLATPGHTPGHHSLLIRLKQFGPVILSGDLWHFTEQVSHNGVPPYNTDRAATLASMDRIQKAAANLKAKLIIQHEKADVPLLPAFPSSAQ